MIFARLVVLTAVIAVVSDTTSDASELLEKFDAATKSIKSYDLTLFVEHDGMPIRFPGIKVSVQASEKSESVRDILAPSRGRFLERTIGPLPTRMRWYCLPEPDDRNKKLPRLYDSGAINYLACIRPFVGMDKDLVDVLKQHDSVGTLRQQSCDNEVQLAVPALSVWPRQITRSIKVWINPEKGYMPTKYEFYWVDGESERQLIGRYSLELKEIRAGSWFPIRVIVERFSLDQAPPAKPVWRSVISVDVAKSAWNIDLESVDEAFIARVMSGADASQTSQTFIDMPGKNTIRLNNNVKTQSYRPL